MTPPQLKTLLLDARLPRLEVRMLLEHVLGKPRAWLLAHDTDPLLPEVAAGYESLAQRRLSGEPMAYLLGHREFMGHRFRVTPDVLIPRPDTEVLVETALECLAGLAAPAVLDLGTGSGAIAISIALARRDARVMASDVSAAALAVAAANAWDLAASVRLVEGSWYEAVPAGEGFDLIVSNPPYVASDDPHLDQGDVRFEPRGALTDGAGGLEDLARIARGAGRHLKRGGALWMEHGWDQAEAVRDLLAQAGFDGVHSRRDLAGIERISGGRLPGGAPGPSEGPASVPGV
ncbi:peptide chain release factor N(5)-glutamine methyltransferase [Achromobacter denitrificans]|uniref:peptide chain release factor N(5)-glutamine methyltransferase n=1 Tax=Achromobacter denitrificans TaxID=32002 RepID=UPI0014658277|nr:peptide chain release factor N(5)-glutamine methyltransferase [Achromobacter denitrificans]MDX3877250.1 peptide chain release factor N(5)-glutamine methyltransferase [Achromobacter sp.]WFC68730.1 peptide chain release factor N(5)-glutamine methyltransferase [Achromobacter denitrificans]GFN26779.1 release factor glutamine methyltransferase [Achromobacter denitrificans]CAB3820086.1 Release factor glutamine methyltransferase [Achromobacter denitrificans]